MWLKVADLKELGVPPRTYQNISNQRDVDYFAHLQLKHSKVLQEWLKTKEHLRLAVEQRIFQEELKTRVCNRAPQFS